MSRFNNLEFGEEFEGQGQLSSHAQSESRQRLVKDETFYRTEAQTAFESGLFEEALRLYAKVLEFNPRNAAAWTGQVRMLIELNEFEEAKKWADKALEQFPDEPELLAAKAVALARLGDLEAAIVYSDASIGERGETPYLWLARGDVQMARREKRADYCFDKAFALAPRNWFVRWLSARIHCYYKKFALALKLIQEALSCDAAQGVLWMQLGFCQQALGLVEPARASFQHARQFDSQSHQADDALRALYQIGFWNKLRRRWRHLFGG
jgi:tetratricopeptide (TPR) repeat protein